MTSRPFAVAVVLAVSLVGDVRAMALQDAPPPAQPPLPRVTLAQSVGPADGTVAVPVQLATPPDRPLQSVTLMIRLPESLTFTKAEISGLGIALGVEATSKAERKGTETQLEVTLTTPPTSGARAALPDGPIAQLMFRLGKGLKPEAVIPLKIEVRGVGTRAGDAVAVSSVDGQIIVANPTVISCFFYMH